MVIAPYIRFCTLFRKKLFILFFFLPHLMGVSQCVFVYGCFIYAWTSFISIFNMNRDAVQVKQKKNQFTI